VNELALAAFAASEDAHAHDREARTQRFARFEASFDVDGYLCALAGILLALAAAATHPAVRSGACAGSSAPGRHLRHRLSHLRG